MSEEVVEYGLINHFKSHQKGGQLRGEEKKEVHDLLGWEGKFKVK